MKNVKIGIIGFGTVGAGVADCLLKNAEVISRRSGINPVLAGIADLDIETDRGVDVPPEILTTDAVALIEEVDVVVELVGGTTVAKKFILDALALGKPVVTANKALLAEAGEELFAAAENSEANIYYEASVAGGIPVIKGLREGLVGNRIEKIVGIMNGTCNYILTKMAEENLDFQTVLDEAQELGYAEADPSLDIDGFDTAHKTAILASLAYGEWFGMEPLHVEGVRGIDLRDLKFADDLGYRVKLLGIIKQEEGDVQLRVHPTLIPKTALLADISGVFNGVLVSGDTVGDTIFYGRGAGRDATASAVVADIVDVALNRQFGSHRRVPPFRIGRQFGKIIPMDEIKSRYYLRLQVVDEPGVISSVSNVFGKRGISISSIFQREELDANTVTLLILTHDAVEGEVGASISELENLECVKDSVVRIRVEDL
ncbi:MAG: homoserine dehydrogenase [Victivallales bacterium]|nr:homoserine dehydrogenase [Victivallales bacterium]